MLLEFVLILTLIIPFYLGINIVAYLWYSTLILLFYYLRSIFRGSVAVLGMCFIFYYYMYRLEMNIGLSTLSKFFYVQLLALCNFTGGSLFLLIGYFIICFSLINYILIRGLYFLALSQIGQWTYCLALCVIYLHTFHEFSLFSLMIGFPLALIFYIKFYIFYQRVSFILVMFLLPVVLSLQIGNVSLFEEGLLSYRLLVCAFS